MQSLSLAVLRRDLSWRTYILLLFQKELQAVNAHGAKLLAKNTYS